MIGIALYLMFATWLSIEHGMDTPSDFEINSVVVSLMLCLLYDVRTWGKK